MSVRARIKILMAHSFEETYKIVTTIWQCYEALICNLQKIEVNKYISYDLQHFPRVTHNLERPR